MRLTIKFNNKIWRLFHLLVFFLLLFFVVEIFELRDNLSISGLRDVIQKNPFWGLLIFVLLFVVGNFIQIPGLVFLAAAVMTLGKTYGGMVTYLAAMISCTVSFVVIRFIGGDMLRNLKYQWSRKVFAKLDRQPVKNVFILRSIFQTLPLLNYGLALSRVSFNNHFIGTMIALPLPLFLYCLFFESVARYFEIL